MARKHYMIRGKLSMIRAVEVRCRDNNETLRSRAREFGVDNAQLHHWIAQTATFEELVTRAHGNAATTSVHPGRKSCLEAIEEELLAFTWEQHKQGLVVSIRVVCMKASQLDGVFRHKSARAKDQAIWHFVSSHGLVHRVHRHQLQTHLSETQDLATDWLQQIRPMLLGGHHDQRFIINMDQTPIFFSMLARTTLEPVGSRTVNVRPLTSSTMRVTVAVTVTAGGNMLPPLFVFKGKPGGQVRWEFTAFHDGGYLLCPGQGMDGRVYYAVVGGKSFEAICCNCSCWN